MLQFTVYAITTKNLNVYDSNQTMGLHYGGNNYEHIEDALGDSFLFHAGKGM